MIWCVRMCPGGEGWGPGTCSPLKLLDSRSSVGTFWVFWASIYNLIRAAGKSLVIYSRKTRFRLLWRTCFILIRCLELCPWVQIRSRPKPTGPKSTEVLKTMFDFKIVLLSIRLYRSLNSYRATILSKIVDKRDPCYFNGYEKTWTDARQKYFRWRIHYFDV